MEIIESRARRALVIASQTGGLRGCESDADLITEALEEQGFSVQPVRGRWATRAGILDAYEALIQDSRPGDAAVVYYSGHGGRTASGGGSSTYLVPMDMKETTQDDFQGILTEELSVLQWRLTLRTRNVSVLLDCCYSGRMSRNALADGMAVRGLDLVWPQAPVTRLKKAAAAEFARLRREHPEEAWLDDNPQAVRMTACSPREEAQEGYQYEYGSILGFFTGAIVPLLKSGTDRTWHLVGEQVRHQVVARNPLQRPNWEGPVERLLFSERSGPTRRAHTVQVGENGHPVWIEGALLHGCEVGDGFVLGRAGESSPAPRHASVVAIRGDAAHLAADDGHPIDAGTVAHPQTTTRAPHRILLDPGDRPPGPVMSALMDMPGVRVDVVPRGGEIASVTLDDDRFSVRDALGRPLSVEPLRADRDGLRRLRDDLLHLSSSVRLTELTPPADGLGTALRLDVRSLTPDTEPAENRSAVRHVGEPVVVSVASDHASPIFANVLDLGVAGRVSLLNTADPAGIELHPGERRTIGEDPGGFVPGLPLGWPPGLPRDEPRYETVLAVFTDRPQDLRLLAQPGVGERAGDDSSAKELVRLLRSGGRDLGGGIRTPVRFFFRRTTFLLCPGGFSCAHR